MAFDIELVSPAKAGWRGAGLGGFRKTVWGEAGLTVGAARVEHRRSRYCCAG
jgi:hypothetical protein